MGNPNGRAVIVGVTSLAPAAEVALQGGSATPLLCTPEGVLYVSDIGGALPPPVPGTAGAPITAFDTPAAAAAPVAAAPADAALVNVLNNLVVTLNAVAAQGVLTVVVRDGATGVGAIIYSFFIGPLAAGTSQVVQLQDLDLRNAAVNTALTVETTAAPAATNFASIAWQGILAQP